jgi:transcriptional antiterminator NusG
MEKEINQNWYILFVRGGREKTIITNAYNLLKSRKLEEQVNEIKILEGSGASGKSKNLLSGYIFVNANLIPEVIATFYAVPDVISFLNHKKSDLNIMPNHLSILEVNNFLSLGRKDKESKSNDSKLKKNDGLLKKEKKQTLLKVGDLILIKEGFFKDYRGAIIKIDDRKELLTINIDFLGRLTPVSVGFSECEKI